MTGFVGLESLYTRCWQLEGRVRVYVCPDCKKQLVQFYCETCEHQYARLDGIPALLSRNPEFRVATEIAVVYESIYHDCDNVWQEQAGRTEAFITYFASLLNSLCDGRLLEIGCGQGFLLAELHAREKFATELSLTAVKAAKSRAHAEFCLALAERLPFETGYFDMVV